MPQTEQHPDTVYGPWEYGWAVEPFPYDDTGTYEIAADWVNGRGLVEDWGCGVGWMSRYIDGEYRGIDGAWSTWADDVVDLRTYRSQVPCAVMRHVLEHNPDWRQVAENFTASWTERAALVLFIPPQLEDVDLTNFDAPIEDIAVSGPDLVEILSAGGSQIAGTQVLWYPPENSIQWSYEAVFLMER